MGGMRRLRYASDADTMGGDADLNIGVYAGGLDVCECSIHLLRHLAGVVDDLASVEERGIRIPRRLVMLLRVSVAGGRSLGLGSSTEVLGHGFGWTRGEFSPFFPLLGG